MRLLPSLVSGAVSPVRSLACYSRSAQISSVGVHTTPLALHQDSDHETHVDDDDDLDMSSRFIAVGGWLVGGVL
jgi:hypothetical protein